MKPVYRGIAVTVLQCLIVLSVAGKYALDRERLPRVWAMAAQVDPSLPVRGRYVSLRLQVEVPPDAGQWTSARLSAVDGRLVATADPTGALHIMPAVVRTAAEPIGTQWVLVERVAFFIPEHVPDPSRRPPGLAPLLAANRHAVGSRRTGRVLHSRTCSRPFAPRSGRGALGRGERAREGQPASDSAGREEKRGGDAAGVAVRAVVGRTSRSARVLEDPLADVDVGRRTGSPAPRITRYGKIPRTRVASATRETARI